LLTLGLLASLEAMAAAAAIALDQATLTGT